MLAGYKYRRKLTFNNTSGGTLANYPVKFEQAINTLPSPTLSLHMNENTGLFAHDESGNLIHGVLVGATWTTGVFGSAISFDGVNDYVTAPNLGGLLSNANVSISCYIRGAGSWVNQGNIFDVNSNSGLRCRVSSGGQLQILDRGATNLLTGSTVLSLGVDYHVVFVAGAAGLKIYLNGVLDGSNATAFGGTISTNELKIGSNAGSAEFFNGKIDEFKWYSGTQLTATQAALAYINDRVRSDYTDVRFTLSDGDTIIPHWRETDGRFWLKIPSFVSGNSDFYIYHGNPAAATEPSDGNTVFPSLFDHFDTLDLVTKWGDTGPDKQIAVGNLEIYKGSIYARNAISAMPGMLVETNTSFAATAVNNPGLSISNQDSITGGNGASNKLMMQLANTGAGVSAYMANGTIASYNQVSAAFLYNQAPHVPQVMGVGIVNGSTAAFMVNRTTPLAPGATWSGSFYPILGQFNGSLSGIIDINDMKIDWILARPYVMADPAATIAALELLLSESITFAETIAKQLSGRTLSETVAIAGSVNKTISKSITNAVTIVQPVITTLKGHFYYPFNLYETVTLHLDTIRGLRFRLNGYLLRWRKKERAIIDKWRRRGNPHF